MKAWRLVEVTIGGSGGWEDGWEGLRENACSKCLSFSASLGRARSSLERSLRFWV